MKTKKNEASSYYLYRNCFFGSGLKSRYLLLYLLTFLLFQTDLKEFQGTEFSVIRDHEEFIWLHDRFVETEDYAGIVVCF